MTGGQQYVTTDTFAVPNGITLGATAHHTSAGEVISLKLKHFVLDAQRAGGIPQEGEGHVHLILDGRIYLAAYTPEFRLVGVPRGHHTLSIQLANDGHSPTPVRITIRFFVP